MKKHSKRPSQKSELEQGALALWRMLSRMGHAGRRYPLPLEHYRFHPARMWKFDFAWPEAKVALEIEGGAFVAGRHVQGVGYAKDCDKYNAATFMGWAIIRLSTLQLRQGPVAIFEQLADLIQARIPVDAGPESEVQCGRLKQEADSYGSAVLPEAAPGCPNSINRAPPFSLIPRS